MANGMQQDEREILQHNLYYQIELTARRVKLHGQQVLASHGIDITIDQWLIVRFLLDKKDVNQLTIGEELYKDKPTISRMIQKLEKKGWIIKRKSDVDAREMVINLTADGRRWAKEMLPMIQQIRADGLDALTLEEKQQLSQALGKIRKSLATRSSE
ncbi:MAG: MarR family transcriptional regulator [Bacteroidota bacterium]